MFNAPTFSEDMLPRHFPKTKEQHEQKVSVAPMPTLPGLSLLLDDDNKVFRAQPSVRNVEPKKSFEQWKQQNQAILFDNLTTPKRRPEEKQVRFETDRQNEQLSPNLELSYHEGSHDDHFCQNRWTTHQQNSKPSAPHFDGCETNAMLTQCNYKQTSAQLTTNNAYNAASQRPLELPQLTHRKIRSESSKENHISRNNQPASNEHRPCNNPNCCQTKNWEVMDYHTYNHEVQPNGCVSQRHAMQPKTISPLGANVERNSMEQLTDDTVLSIMEEQQQHILLQQSQIMMQQKQNMMQQNQIFMLQRQVQKLMLRNGITSANEESPPKHCQIPICDKPATIPNLPSAFKTRSGTVDAVRNGATSTTTKSSIGVMTSFVGNINDDGIPTGMQQFNERLTSKVANEKFIENLVGGEYSYKDSMLDKINDAIKNSSAMVDYRNNEMDDDGCASANRQSDLNVATKALFYETTSTNNGGINEPKSTDRSFALYMLGMKYDCTQDDSSKNYEKRDAQSKQTNGRPSDQVSVNLSPEVYDYLKRHGLLRQE